MLRTLSANEIRSSVLRRFSAKTPGAQEFGRRVAIQAAASRNREWEYRAFRADKRPNEDVKLTACFECHKPLASQNFVHAYDKLKEAGR